MSILNTTSMPKAPNTKPAVSKNALVRALFAAFGGVFLALGVAGIILPGVPTTVFVLMAAYCWARSSARFHAWLMAHRVFGRIVRDWEERQAVPRRAKYLAWSMMSLSNAWLYYSLPSEKLWLLVLSLVVCAIGALWLYRLPDA
ncbi:Inner membrane protein ybaN [Moraxella caviae]|nr:YbaN family protein [Moraxella caviae]STZ10322.1 Inner membrane protein ybaN [Moraxella caviae]